MNPWIGPINATLKHLKLSYGRSRCNLNLVRLSRSLPIFGRLGNTSHNPSKVFQQKKKACFSWFREGRSSPWSDLGRDSAGVQTVSYSYPSAVKGLLLVFALAGTQPIFDVATSYLVAAMESDLLLVARGKHVSLTYSR